MSSPTARPLGTANDDIDLPVCLDVRVQVALAMRAAVERKTVDQLVGEALERHLARMSARSPTSRNEREGRYAGRYEHRHVRAHDIATTVWLGDEVWFVSPVPSPGAAWGVIYRRLTKPEAQ